MSDAIAVLLDMDGTLIDSRETVIGCARATFRDLGHELDPNEDLGWIVGPPLVDTFGAILARFGDDRVAEGVSIYREHYARHMADPSPVFPGWEGVLEAMVAAGWRLFLATSKALPFAREILDKHGLSPQFSGFYGADLNDGGAEKPELIARLLKTEGLDPARAVMVGDRRFDIAGAQANRVRSLGVLWGYGGREELTAAGADGLVAAPADLPGTVAAMFPTGVAAD